VKLVRANSAGFTFQLRKTEKELLFDLLQRYPCIPAGHHQLSKSDHGAAEAENQRLLDEALAAHRQEQQQEVRALLNEPGRFAEVRDGWRFQLTAPQVEWLLQVLNDVRVGNWVTLGSPDFEKGEQVALTDENSERVWLMETAGFFQHHLLEAVGSL
jgi:hypothetical protein